MASELQKASWPIGIVSVVTFVIIAASSHGQPTTRPRVNSTAAGAPAAPENASDPRLKLRCKLVGGDQWFQIVIDRGRLNELNFWPTETNGFSGVGQTGQDDSTYQISFSELGNYSGGFVKHTHHINLDRVNSEFIYWQTWERADGSYRATSIAPITDMDWQNSHGVCGLDNIKRAF